MNVASLHVYPVKGCRGISLARTEVLAGGFAHDRRFMVLDAHDRFLTQRSHPRLALVATSLSAGALHLRTPSGATATLPTHEAAHGSGPRRRVRVWDDEVDAVVVDGDAARLLSDHLEEACALVFMPDDVVRPVEAPYGRPGDRVGFADAYPVLLASLPSLGDLNARLEVPVPMDRFRPNVVVEGGAPYEEERHATARIGDVTFRMPKRCSRCAVTTVDQRTGVASKEPLRTLATFRAEGNNVYFAQNLVPDLPPGSAAVVSVGDAVRYA